MRGKRKETVRNQTVTEDKWNKRREAYLKWRQRKAQTRETGVHNSLEKSPTTKFYLET